MKRKLKRVFWITLAVGVVGIGLAWLLIPDFGLMVGRRYRMYFVGNTFPVSYLQATPIGDSIFVSWENPNDSRFDHTELYYSTSGVPDQQATRVPTVDKKASYLWFKPDPQAKAHYFSAYAVDGNNQYAPPVSDRLNAPTTKSPPPDGIFSYYYEFHRIIFNHPYYLLENEHLKCWFANGTLMAIENKQSGLTPEYNPFGPIHSFTNSMDTWEVVAPEVSYPIFSMASDRFAGGGDSTWLETQVDSNAIAFTRHRVGEGAFARMRYTLDSTSLHVSLEPLNASKYNVRFNTFGNANFKAVTHWEARQVKGQIVEDGKEEEQYAKAEANTQPYDYAHQDKVFNDDYPYLESRTFVLMGSETTFHLFHHDQELFVLRDIKGTEDFLYKNCSGEENFSFGMRWPYEKHVTTIDQGFSFVVEVVY